MQESPNNYSVKVSMFSVAFLLVLHFVNNLLEFLGLRTKQVFWGIVYDSVTKQPLDPVIVRLVYADSTQEVERCVTDLNGRYGFLARPGKFKILVKKSNYSFPSSRVTGDRDGTFERIYHGEFFSLDNDSEVIAPNIPMDPETFDWNQQAKRSMTQTSPYLLLLSRRIVAVFFWFGFFLAMAYITNDFFRTYSVTTLWALILAAVYLMLFLMALVVPSPRLWGKVKISSNPAVGTGLMLCLVNPAIPSVQFGKAHVEQYGKFFLRSNPGRYTLQVYETKNDGSPSVMVASLPVRVFATGVLNATIVVDKLSGR